METTERSHVDGLHLSEARRAPSSARPGRPVSAGARLALFVANATVALFCLLAEFFVLWVTGVAAADDPTVPWMTVLGVALFVAACAAIVVLVRLVKHGLWSPRWQAVVAVALAVVVVMSLNAPAGI